jgi:5-oxoprolinase (ATP-hydrolysing) subunit A
MITSMDINCDLGESFGTYRLGDDERLLAQITSANVACGYHAGDPATMRRTVKACLMNGVAVGAHPGLPDLVGFGRREMAVSPEEVYEFVLYQIGALRAFVRAEGAELSHVKPHGALYHMAEKDRAIAEAIARAAAAADANLAVYALAGGQLATVAAEHGLRACHEAFADRTYERAGKLTPRGTAGAVIAEPSQAAAQALQIATQGTVRTREGEIIPLKADTLCIHGDQPRAAEIAEAVRIALQGLSPRR